MTTYVHSCANCGEMELERSMKDPAPTKCPVCKRPGLERIYDCQFVRPPDMFQENQNKGAGMWYPELGARYLDAHTKTKINPDAYARSQNEAIEKFKKKGVSVSKC